MAHKTLFKPSLILTLRLNKTAISFSHHHPFRHSQPPFPFLNTSPISLPPTTRITNYTHLWCSNYTTLSETIEGSEKCYLNLSDEELMRQSEVVSTVTSVNPQCASNTYPLESLLRFHSQNLILLHFSSWGSCFCFLFFYRQMLVFSFC